MSSSPTTARRRRSSTRTARSRAGSGPARRPGNCDGSFTVNEPIGAQSWFPSQQPSLRQGDLRAAHDRAQRLHGDRRRRAGLADRQRRRDQRRRPGSRTRRWRPTSRPGPSASSTSTTGTMTDHTGGATIPIFTRDRQRRFAAAQGRRHGDGGADPGDGQLPLRPPRALPVRDRRARRRLGTRRRLRAREPDQAALRRRQGRPRRPAARRSPTSSPTSGWATASRPPTGA